MTRSAGGSPASRRLFGGRRLFTSNFTGLANRLEGLTLSFAIAEKFGHEICLDWPEFEAIHVVGTTARKLAIWDWIGSIKIRNCDERLFATLGKYRTIIQRGVYGPNDILDRLYLETVRRIRLKSPCAQFIRNSFAQFGDRPIVGVHVRGGDFAIVDADSYDARRARHQAIPLWWYEHVMRAYTRSFPGTAFLLCHSGDPERFTTLKRNFDVFELATSSPPGNRAAGHLSARHPVVDLFALACCNVIIATPNSSFSHFAANAMGHPSAAIIPPQQTSRDNPSFGIVRLYGRRLPAWMAASADAAIFQPAGDAAPAPAPLPPRTDWIQTPD